MHNNKMIEERLFALLRMAMWQSCEDYALFDGITDEEWVAIYDKSVEQGVLALAFDGVQQLPKAMQPRLNTKVQWGFNVQHIEKLYNKQRAAAQKLVSLYSANNIRTLIMKGLNLASYYPTPSHRQFGDIDIYLMGDFERGNDLVRSKGVEIRHDFFVHTEFVINGVNIENHRWFVNPDINATGRYVQEQLVTLAEDLQPFEAIDGAYTPSPEFNALFLSRHSSWHYARECIRLRDLCDWAMFLNKEASNLDTDKTMTLLRESGLERYASIITGICRKSLGLEVSLPFTTEYPDLVERVEEDIMTFDNPEKHNNIGFLRAFFWKTRNRLSRKWCYDKVVPDSFWGNIGYSITNYLKQPFAIFRAKL